MAKTVREGRRISENELRVRNSLWTDADKLIWDRQVAKGFATIPKTSPIVHRIMDEMAGVPVSPVYYGLWCMTWDNGFVRLNKPADMAYAAGFTGQRAERTWRERLKLLEKLGFVLVKPNGGEKLGFALIPNPHAVIFRHREAGTEGLREGSFNALITRALEVGCKDIAALLDAKAATATAAEPPASPPAGPPTTTGALSGLRIRRHARN